MITWNILIIGFCLVVVLPDIGHCDETSNYRNHINDIAPDLLSKNYQLLSSIDKNGLPIEGVCDSSCSALINGIEAGKYRFIEPIIYTNSGSVFYKYLVDETPCRDIGILSYVDSVADMRYSDDQPNLDFYRPTDGFAIYRLPYPYDQTLLIRAEDYVDSGKPASSQNSIDFVGRPEDDSPRDPIAIGYSTPGRFIEVTASSCLSKHRGFLIAKPTRFDENNKTEIEDRNSWISNPILFNKKIYFLNVEIVYPELNTPQTFKEYVLKIEQATALNKIYYSFFYK